MYNENLKERFYVWSRKRHSTMTINSPRVSLRYETDTELLFQIYSIDQVLVKLGININTWAPVFNFKIWRDVETEKFSADWLDHCDNLECLWINMVRETFAETLENILDVCVEKYGEVLRIEFGEVYTEEFSSTSESYEDLETMEEQRRLTTPRRF